MAFKSEAEVWAEERERIASKRTIADRMAAWVKRPTPEPDPYAWHDVASLIDGEKL